MLFLVLAVPALATPPLRADLRRVHPVRASVVLTLDPGSTTFTGTEDLTVAVSRGTKTSASTPPG